MSETSAGSTEGQGWAILRQVIFAAEDNAAAGALVRERLGLGTGFEDPGLATINMTDNTIPVGEGSFLEIISPWEKDTSLGRWLAKRGGAGGYMLAVQIPDIEGVRARAAEMGIDEILRDTVDGHELSQYSPWELGLIFEADGIADPDVWYWDEVGWSLEPDAAVTDIVDVEVAVEDPDKVTALWHQLLDLPPSGEREVKMGHRVLRFVPGEGKGRMTAMTLKAAGDTPREPEELLGLTVRYA
jgi:hypothetical protein